MHHLLDALLDLLFPPRCCGCRARGALLCPSCLRACRPVSAAINQVLHQRVNSPFLASTAGAYHFEGVVREALHALKYARRARLAGPLGSLLIAYARQQPVIVDAIVPVPLHPERERQRGFNQAALLAAPLARALGVPLLTDGLARTRNTARQADLGREQRRANVRAAFAWCAAAAPPARLLLIDDVITTGVTVAAVAQALCEAGAREVHALALARRV
ncbi:ComF family protein [Kallotenue papyrolyticum]|uniref:ComF family protein n=1 Tax=Kallotenue papyrolyticum TaxID=1325125 RepID=UPI0004785ED2|nr:ComF family protein [Kallotenue papyrolyticum]